MEGEEMNTSLEEIKAHPLFKGIDEKDLIPTLQSLGCFVKEFKKDEFIIFSDETIRNLGVILEGCVQMVKEDEKGNDIILVRMGVNELFGETFACGSITDPRVRFRASTDCKVLFLHFYKVISLCDDRCDFRYQVLENLIKLFCDKNVKLLRKIESVSQRTLREKILKYLTLMGENQESSYVEIPLGRGEMADYLCADRSALTRELNRMRNEGIIDFEKNIFKIL